MTQEEIQIAHVLLSFDGLVPVRAVEIIKKQRKVYDCVYDKAPYHQIPTVCGGMLKIVVQRESRVFSIICEQHRSRYEESFWKEYK